MLLPVTQAPRMFPWKQTWLMNKSLTLSDNRGRRRVCRLPQNLSPRQDKTTSVAKKQTESLIMSSTSLFNTSSIEIRASRSIRGYRVESGCEQIVRLQWWHFPGCPSRERDEQSALRTHWEGT